MYIIYVYIGCVGPAPVYFHARSCTRMTPQEVTRILQDPHAVPDSDDEEDQVQWKVRLLTQLVQPWHLLLLLRLTAVMCLSVASSSHHAMCCWCCCLMMSQHLFTGLGSTGCD